jgi:hypothetical protein
MGIGQIQAGKAYVSIYGDKSPLVLALQEMGPEIRKQGEMLAKIGAATSNNFSKSNVAIAETSDRAAAAEAALQGMRASANSVSRAAQAAMISTAETSRITADGVTKIVNRMDQVKPAAKGFAAAFASIKNADVTLASGAFGVASMINLLKAGGPAAKPLLDALNGITGKASKIPKAVTSATTAGAGASGTTGGGMDLGALSKTSNTSGIHTVSGIAAQLNQTYARIYGLIKSRKIMETGKSGNTKLYDQAAIDALKKAIESIDAGKANPSALGAAQNWANAIYQKIVSSSKGNISNMMGLQSMYEIMEAGGKKAYQSIVENERVMTGLGVAAGIAKGSVDGAWKTIVNGSKLAAIVGVNIAGGLAGVKGVFAPVLGQMTALQKAANSAQWATLFVGSREQRKIAKQMGLEADAAAIGEAFARGWIPGFAKYLKIGIPRAILSGTRGLASLPGMAIGGAFSLFRRGQSDEINKIGSAAAGETPRVNLLTEAIVHASRAVSASRSIFGLFGRVAGSTLSGSFSALASIGHIGSSHTDSASNKALDIGASATSQRRSVGSTAELAFGAEATGTSLKTVDSAMDHFKSTVKSANDGTEKSIELMNKLGVSAEKLASMSTDQVMQKLGQALNRIKDPADRDRVAIEALGESGTELVPLLTDLEGFRARAQQSGSLLTEKDVAAAKAMKLAMSQLKATLSNLWNTIGAASIRSTTAWIEGAARFIEKNQGIVGTLMKITAGIVGAAGAFVIWDHLGGPVMTLMRGIGFAVAALASPLGLVTLGITAGVAAWAYFTTSGNQAISHLMQIFGEFHKFFNDVWSGIVAAVKKGDLALAGRIAWAGLQLGFLEAVRAMGGDWQKFLRMSLNGARVFSAAWNNVWTGMVSGWRNAQNFIAKGITRLMGMIAGKDEATIREEMATLDQMADFDNKAHQAKMKQAFDDQQSQIDAMQNALIPDDKRIAQLKAELAQMVAQAKAAEINPANKPANIGTPEFGAASSGKSSSQAGTFSAIAAVGLGGGNVMDKIERNTAETTVALKKIASSKTKKMVFGGGAGF